MKKSNNIVFMNRPIAYRAWDGKKMIDVQTISWNAGGIIWHASGCQMGWAWINPEYKGWSESNPKPGEKDIYPVMQWTGFKDNEGKDIWEGDIVHLSYSRGHERDSSGDYYGEYQVVFKHGEWSAVPLNDYNDDTEYALWLETSDYAIKRGVKCLVVGNVFQNPESLES